MRTALVVDDSRSIRQLVTFTLQQAGFQVLDHENGQAGLDALKAAAKVDVIITDLNMPVMDGLTFIRHARSLPTSQKTPILILTTESNAGFKMKGKEAGATGWIVKPFQPEQLLKVIDKVVAA